MIHSKDWTGNAGSVFKTLGASNHTDHERQHEDYYATGTQGNGMALPDREIRWQDIRAFVWRGTHERGAEIGRV